MKALKWEKGFTLMEIIIVMAIIAILATILIPNIGGFDTEARITATKSNLDNLRSAITLFRAKKGRYPENLNELVTKTYLDRGVKKRFLRAIPKELISSKEGNNTVEVQMSTEPLSNNGGWTYFKDTAEVVVDVNEPLGSEWDDYADEIPSKW